MEISRTFDFFPWDSNIIIRQRNLHLYLLIAFNHIEKPQDAQMERKTNKGFRRRTITEPKQEEAQSEVFTLSTSTRTNAPFLGKE
jgi:hypothetical protein